MKSKIAEHCVRFLPFDTEIFGVKCGRLNINEKGLSKEALKSSLKEAKEQQIEHLVVKVPSEWVKICNFLENINFRFKVCSLVLEKKITQQNNNLEDVFVYEKNNDYRLIEITEKAFSSGTRFHFEPMFSTSQTAQLHRRWIVNLINDKDVKIYIHLIGGEITGYITIKPEDISKRKGYVGLFAVDKAYRGKGIGSMLLKGLEDDFYDEVDVLSVTTESINYSALKAYFNAGYSIKKSWSVFHLKVT